MNRSWIAAVTAGFVLSLAACSNPDNSRAPQSKGADANPSVTLTGCLVPGTGPNEFVLQNVRPKDTQQQSMSLTAASYTVVASSNSVDLAKELNHQVEIKGRTDNSVPSPTTEARVDQTMPPKLIANDIKSIADKCTAPAQQ
jgi:hypothetical protein